jgi:hypothetical protein
MREVIPRTLSVPNIKKRFGLSAMVMLGYASGKRYQMRDIVRKLRSQKSHLYV